MRITKFTVPDEETATQVARYLGGKRAGGHETQHVSRRYLDSFDWRLHRAQTELFAESAPGPGYEMHLSHGGQWRRWHATELPSTVGDLPPGPVRSRLGQALSIRALCTVAAVDVDRQVFELHGPGQKVIVRLTLDRLHGEPAKPLPPYLLEVGVLRGYEKSARKAIKRLRSRFDLQPFSGDLFDGLLAREGRSRGDYSSKIRSRLKPKHSASESLALLFAEQAAMIEANVAGTMDDVDTEFLHDLRVAVRRTRSLLSMMKAHLPRQERKRFAEQFRWLGQATGRKRDLDVYLLGFDDYLELLPEENRAALKPVKAFLKREHRQARTSLRRLLVGERFRTLMTEWGQFLATLTDSRDRHPECIRRVARDRIQQLFLEVLEEGGKLGPDSPPDPFHELRKTCKKLRYLFEFFQSLFKRKDVARCVKALKELQDILGGYQDCCVQVDFLNHLGQQMHDSGGCSAETLLSIGMLVQIKQQKADSYREGFAEAFGHFSSAANVRHVRAMCR